MQKRFRPETFLHDGLMKSSLSTTPLIRFTGRSKREARRKLTVCSPPPAIQGRVLCQRLQSSPQHCRLYMQLMCCSSAVGQVTCNIRHLASVQISNLRIFLWIQFLSVQLLCSGMGWVLLCSINRLLCSIHWLTDWPYNIPAHMYCPVLNTNEDVSRGSTVS